MSTAQNLVDALKPCPFCGNANARHEEGEFGFQVSCDPRAGCGAITDYHNTETLAAAAWNTRAVPEDEPFAWFWKWVGGSECGVLMKRQDYEQYRALYPKMIFTPVYTRPRATGAVPAGWKLVPDSATHNMLNAANQARKKGHSSSGAIYAAMLAASPSAPATESAG